MNFSRAKSYLIVLFVLVNIFLIYNLYKISNSEKISEQTIDKTVKILEEKDIIINKSEISNNTDAMFYLNLKNPLADKEHFYSSLKGKVEFLPEGFTFYPEKKYYSFSSKLPSFKTSKKIVSYLKDMGLSAKYLKWTGTMDIGNNTYKASFIQSYEDHDIYNTKLDVYFSDNTISKISGIYYNLDSFSTPEGEIKDQTEILIRFSSDLNSMKATVKSIENGYFTPAYNSDYSLISAVPCYRISIDDGSYYYYDAVTGKLLNLDKF